MRALPAALFATALLLAGCSGVPFVGESDDPMPVATPIPGDRLTDPAPPGVSSGRILHPTALGRAHARAIENESYVLTTERTVRREDGALLSRLAVEVALDADRSYHVNVSTAGPGAPVFVGPPPAAATYWANDTSYVRRLTHDGRTTYAASEAPRTWIGTWRYWAERVPFGGGTIRPGTFYASLFSAVPTRPDGQTALEGTSVFRFEDRDGVAVSTEAFPARVESIHDVSLLALIDGDGFVRSLDLRYAGTVDGEPVRVHRTVRYANVGSTDVSRPSWYARATANATSSGDPGPG